MTVWGSILIAVVTAGATIGVNETVRILRERAARKRLSADWNVTWVNHDSRLRVKLAVIENVGRAEAFNVNITITGDSKFELHPDAPINVCRPRDAILVMVSNAGTGVFRIDWNGPKGVNQGPVFRFPAP